MALRDMRKHITRQDFEKAKKSVLATKKAVQPAIVGMYT